MSNEVDVSDATGIEMLRIDFGSSPLLDIYPGIRNITFGSGSYGTFVFDANYNTNSHDPMTNLFYSSTELTLLTPNEIATGAQKVSFGTKLGQATCGPIRFIWGTGAGVDTKISRLFTEGSSANPYYVFPTLAATPFS
jgi:hypothetical protein